METIRRSGWGPFILIVGACAMFYWVGYLSGYKVGYSRGAYDGAAWMMDVLSGSIPGGEKL